MRRRPIAAARSGRGECIDCHGTQARGRDKGPNLVRSVVVLHDRYGSELGPFLKKGHKLQSGTPSASLTDAQIQDLAHFLRQRVNDTLRGSPLFQVAERPDRRCRRRARRIFNGEGKCTTCHSPTGNLAGIGARLEPVDSSSASCSPATGPAAGAVAAAPPAPSPDRRTRHGDAARRARPCRACSCRWTTSTCRCATRDGHVRSVRSGRRLKVVKNDPLGVHVELLDRLTDKNMHDLVAYLETLK